MRHVQEGKTGHIEDLPYGIRTFKEDPFTKKRHEIDEMMGRKNRVGGLEEMRNYLDMKSLGDKIYRHPDYSKDYFKVPRILK